MQRDREQQRGRAEDAIRAAVVERVPRGDAPVELWTEMGFRGARIGAFPPVPFPPRPESSAPRLCRLRRLDLSCTGLCEVPQLDECPYLEELDLSDNTLVSLSRLPSMPFLRVLLVDRNRLEALDVRGAMPRLTHLSVSENRLTSLRGLHAFPSVSHVSASNNRIAHTDIHTHETPCICFLDLDRNMLADFTELYHLRTNLLMRELCVRENPVRGECDSGTSGEPVDGVSLRQVRDLLGMGDGACACPGDVPVNTYVPPPVPCGSMPSVDEVRAMRDEALGTHERHVNSFRLAVLSVMPQLRVLDGADVTQAERIGARNWLEPPFGTLLMGRSVFW